MYSPVFFDFSLFIQASRLLFYQQTAENWKSLCDINEKALNGSRRTNFDEDIELSEIAEKIEWRPGQMPHLESKTKEGELLYIIPIWYDDGLIFKKNLIIILKPRLLDLENKIETPKVKKGDTLYTRFYRLIYYFLTKNSYECRLQSDMCNAIIHAETTIKSADTSIKPQRDCEFYPGFLDKDFSWPMDFSEIKGLFEACWVTYINITNERQAGAKDVISEGEAFWERDDLEGELISAKQFCEYLEKKMSSKLCSPEKPPCKIQLCVDEEREKINLYLDMCPLIKWPLLFKEKMYTAYFDVNGEDKDTETSPVKGYIKRLIDFNKKYPFIHSFEREEERGENSGKRFFIHFC